MSITDELRDVIRTATKSYEDMRNPYNDREICHIPEEQLEAVADRIDKKLSDRYVEYPTDADGTPIHEGDKLVYCGDEVVLTVDAVYYADGWLVVLTDDDVYHRADECKKYLRHAEPDTWERIIEDAAQFGHDDMPCHIDMERYVARCRALGVRLYG